MDPVTEATDVKGEPCLKLFEDGNITDGKDNDLYGKSLLEAVNATSEKSPYWIGTLAILERLAQAEIEAQTAAGS